jgi:hypothetical protein
MDVEVERTQEDLKHLSVQESRAPTPDREEVFPLDTSKDHQQREVTMPRGDKNQNRKRNTETQITERRIDRSARRKPS